ncbi:hypothetical protein PaG_03462 [Moesziomyces aphidis]|uniref:LSM complex subunit LSM4 n=1 Tax=Moesziomyces aphidis TaxID=84754 RepID=W3VNL8_MOEAP|nr:hypothetical protein PaG_03462 [Moesziomyces aphidis]
MGAATKAPTTILIFASEPALLSPHLLPHPHDTTHFWQQEPSRTHHPAPLQLRFGAAAPIRQIRALAPDCPPTLPLFHQSHSQTRTRHAAAIAAECSAEQADGKRNPFDPLALDHALILGFTWMQLVELKNGSTFNGHLVACDNFMNLTLREVYETSASGEQFWKQKECYIRGSTIKYCRVADSVIDQVKETEEAARKQRQQGGGGLSGGVSLGARGGGRGNHRGSRGGGPDRGRGSARGRGRGQ